MRYVPLWKPGATSFSHERIVNTKIRPSSYAHTLSFSSSSTMLWNRKRSANVRGYNAAKKGKQFQSPRISERLNREDQSSKDSEHRLRGEDVTPVLLGCRLFLNFFRVVVRGILFLLVSYILLNLDGLLGNLVTIRSWLLRDCRLCG